VRRFTQSVIALPKNLSQLKTSAGSCAAEISCFTVPGVARGFPTDGTNWSQLYKPSASFR